MDPLSWVNAASTVLGTFKGSTKISGAAAGSSAGAAGLDLGTWTTGSAKNPLYKWAILGGAVLVGLVIIKRKYK